MHIPCGCVCDTPYSSYECGPCSHDEVLTTSTHYPCTACTAKGFDETEMHWFASALSRQLRLIALRRSPSLHDGLWATIRGDLHFREPLLTWHLSTETWVMCASDCIPSPVAHALNRKLRALISLAWLMNDDGYLHCRLRAHLASLSFASCVHLSATMNQKALISLSWFMVATCIGLQAPC